MSSRHSSWIWARAERRSHAKNDSVVVFDLICMEVHRRGFFITIACQDLQTDTKGRAQLI